MQVGGVDLEVLVLVGGQAQLVQRVGGVGDQLPQEHVLGRVDRVDHQLQQLASLRLELDRLGRHRVTGAFHNPPVQGSQKRAQAQQAPWPGSRAGRGGHGCDGRSEKAESTRVRRSPDRARASTASLPSRAWRRTWQPAHGGRRRAAVHRVALGGPLLAATLIYRCFALANLICAVTTPRILAWGRSSKTMLAVAVSGLAVFTPVTRWAAPCSGRRWRSALSGPQRQSGFSPG